MKMNCGEDSKDCHIARSTLDQKFWISGMIRTDQSEHVLIIVSAMSDFEQYKNIYIHTT